MKTGRFVQAARLMAAELIEVEDKQVDAGEIQSSLSVKVNVATSAMLNVLSDHFGQSRYAFGGEILDDFTADFFAALPDELRVTVAEKADLLATEMLTKLGMTVHSEGVLGVHDDDTTWRMQNWFLNYNDEAA